MRRVFRVRGFVVKQSVADRRQCSTAFKVIATAFLLYHSTNCFPLAGNLLTNKRKGFVA